MELSRCGINRCAAGEVMGKPSYKPGLELPPPGKVWRDLIKQGQCIICHAPLYGWQDIDRDICGEEVCFHPDDLCKSPECAEKRRIYYRGKRKVKHPCAFPRLRDKVLP
jgi:hypothetical protein